MSNKLLIISGPTASGKTALALKLVQKFNGEIISADSRQIYKYLDIGTGKDHPKKIKVHLIDLINPNETFSVAEFRKMALEKIFQTQAKNKLPILVGCSGFYIDSTINPQYDTFSIKPNLLLRSFLDHLPVSFLQNILKIINKQKYLILNNSDLHNPRRLIRKIEIKLSGKTNDKRLNNNFDILHLSLTAPHQYLYDRIDTRVESRLKLGFLNELKKILKKYNWTNPGLKISAYACLKSYINNPSEIILKECISKWKFREHRDARRQLTWFKKNTRGIFVDITQPDFVKKVNKMVTEWYNQL
jgi:tRNA dimethylallyltransferase